MRSPTPPASSGHVTRMVDWRVRPDQIRPAEDFECVLVHLTRDRSASHTADRGARHAACSPEGVRRRGAPLGITRSGADRATVSAPMRNGRRAGLERHEYVFGIPLTGETQA